MADCKCAAKLAGLTKSVGKIYQKNGADYHTGEQIISFLNENPGPDSWSFRVLEHGYEELSDEMWAIVELLVKLPKLHEAGEECATTVVTKQDAGAHQVKRHSQTKLPLSIGDDRKSAITDGLKRCARQLGIGLSLWEKDPEKTLPYKRDDNEELARGNGRPTGPVRPTGAPADRPAATEPPKRTFSTGEVRTRAEDRYSEILSRATDEGFRAAWTARPPAKLSDQELRRYGTQLKEHLDALEAERAATSTTAGAAA